MTLVYQSGMLACPLFLAYCICSFWVLPNFGLPCPLFVERVCSLLPPSVWILFPFMWQEVLIFSPRLHSGFSVSGAFFCSYPLGSCCACHFGFAPLKQLPSFGDCARSFSYLLPFISSFLSQSRMLCLLFQVLPSFMPSSIFEPVRGIVFAFPTFKERMFRKIFVIPKVGNQNYKVGAVCACGTLGTAARLVRQM